MPEPPPVTMQILFENRMAVAFAPAKRDARAAVETKGCGRLGTHLAGVTGSLRFGVATADHQCEAYDGHDDIRDVWERVRGLVPRGKATDFWNRYREDIELARGLGCTVFRLSLSWARLEPEPGVWNDEAFAHYREVLQGLRDAGMSAVVTLLHNTWPLHVQAAGGGAGLLDKGFPDRLARFAQEVAQRLGDLIGDYVTINEPNQLVYGWIKGFWMRAYPMPPGQPPYESGDAQMDDVLTLIPNLFRAHAKARAVIRRIRPSARVGTNPLVLGLPRWLQRWIDRAATHLKSPEDVKRQAARIAQSAIVEGGRVDCSIAQLTMTLEREQHAFFSEPYYRTHLAVLHRSAFQLPQPAQEWRGNVAVVADTLPARIVAGWFPAATIRYLPAMPEAVEALRRGDADALFDDDVTLQEYAGDSFGLTPLPNSAQYFAVAMALGSRTLLNIVDRAIRDLRREHPEIPNAFNRKTVAHVGREDEAQTAGSARDRSEQEPVPKMDRSVERIRRRGKLRVGIHPGVAGLCTLRAEHRERLRVDAEAPRYEGLEPNSAAASRNLFSATPAALSSWRCRASSVWMRRDRGCMRSSRCARASRSSRRCSARTGGISAWRASCPSFFARANASVRWTSSASTITGACRRSGRANCIGSVPPRIFSTRAPRSGRTRST